MADPEQIETVPHWTNSSRVGSDQGTTGWFIWAGETLSEVNG